MTGLGYSVDAYYAVAGPTGYDAGEAVCGGGNVGGVSGNFV